MRRVIVVTQHVDPAHPALAATVPMLRALAGRVDEVVVFAASSVPGVLPANCRVRSYRASTRLRRGARFAAGLAQELSRGRPVAVVAHMCPIYAVLAAPLARPLRVPVLLWFTHWKASRLLRLAEVLSTRIVTVNRFSFPLRSRKVRPIGHGIDLSEFPCRPAPEHDGGLRLVTLGRSSPAKGLRAVIDAVRAAQAQGVPVELEILGPSLTAEEEAHRRELEQLAGDGIVVGGAVDRASLPELFAQVDALVNNTRAGALDKVVFEACASCVPAIASNPSFSELLDDRFRFDRDDVPAIADRLVRLAALSREERDALGRSLRERVARSHSVDSWADGVLRAAEER